MLESLIGSKTMVSLLTLFLLTPGKEYYILEISRNLDIDVAPLRKELSNLESIGLLRSERHGNQKYYWVDESCFIFGDLQRLVLKTEGIARILTEKFADSGEIDILFIFGSFAAGKAHDKSVIDLFIVGDVSDDELLSMITETARQLGREINYTLLRRNELIQRIQKNDPFMVNVIREPKIFVVGQNEFEKLGKPGKD